MVYNSIVIVHGKKSARWSLYTANSVASWCCKIFDQRRKQHDVKQHPQDENKRVFFSLTTNGSGFWRREGAFWDLYMWKEADVCEKRPIYVKSDLLKWPTASWLHQEHTHTKIWNTWRCTYIKYIDDANTSKRYMSVFNRIVLNFIFTSHKVHVCEKRPMSVKRDLFTWKLIY